MSCTCQVCGRKYRVDLWVPDELWAQIRPDKSRPQGAGLMCGPCTAERIEDRGQYDAYHLASTTKTKD